MFVTSSLGKRRNKMEKAEILAKAQKENKGADIADLEAQRKGTNIAYTVGGLTFIAIIIVDLIVTKVAHFEILGGLFVMLAVAFFVKSYYSKKRHELIIGILYTLCALAAIASWIVRLVHPF